jgi:SHS family lactate transporter-like MFS transporter
MVRVPKTQRLTGDQRNSFIAALLGWTMDAFDYFIVVLVYADIAKTFHQTTTQVAFLTTATLLMRPVGALLFGLWADRVGRRLPLMVDVAFYSVVGFLCAFAPNFTVLAILRLLYGIGMGGEWGLGFLRPASGGLRIWIPARDTGVAVGDGLAGTIVALALRA